MSCSQIQGGQRRDAYWPEARQATDHVVREHNGSPLTFCVNGTRICIDGHCHALILESYSKSPEQKCKLGIEHHKEKVKISCFICTSKSLSSQPFENCSQCFMFCRISEKSYSGQSVHSWRMWHKALGDWIHSWATFCPKLICALCTDAKIIQFMECYANTHWTLWDS